LSAAAGITIRRASAGDIPALARVWHESLLESHGALSFGVHPDVADFERRTAKLLPGCLIAEKATGACGFTAWEGGELYLLFVLPVAYGTGLGEELLARAEVEMAAGGPNEIFLLCRAGNDRARRFYEKHGWRFARLVASEEGSFIGYRENTMWRMEKRLTQR